MFTRKNKGNDTNKKTRKEVLQKGGECTAEEEIRKGINNIGNTCYLNSLYQLLYSIYGFSELIQTFHR